jgi:predicted Zn-dependent protease
MEINNYLQTLHTIIDMYKLLMNIKYNLQSNLIFIEDVFTSIYHTMGHSGWFKVKLL